jgi:Carboxypeptidase regulatory-like domain
MRVSFLTALFAGMSVFCAGLWAQSAAVSQISGVVRDSSGSTVPNAQVKATQTATGLVRNTTSGSDGAYTLPSLPVGPYQLEVTKAGFSTYVQSGIVLQVNTNPAIDVTLQVGQVTQQVQVEAAATMVETRSTGVGQVVDQQRVVDLPLDGRNATELISLAGATTAAPSRDLISSKNYPGETSLSVGGGLATGTEYLLDGATHNDPFNNLSLPLPFPDALQEFKVETSALPAQYGQHSAGAVNAVTKSGSNAFHGDAFEFVRNYKFNARNFFAPTRDSLKRNQFGGTLGGPIKKDKLFFFLGYQGTIIRSNPTQTFSFIPTPDMLNGDFSTIASAQCNAGRPKTLKAPFVDNMISPTMFSPAAVKMMSYYPTTTDPCGKSYFATVQSQDEHMGIARVDYQLSASQSMFVRYLVTHSLQPTPFDGKNPLTMTLSGADDLVNAVVVGHTWVMNPTTLNSLRVTFNRASITGTQVPTFDAPSLGVNMHTLLPGYTKVSVSGAIYSASLFSYPKSDPTNDQQISDDFSLIRGNHQLQFGANWIRQAQDVYGPLFSDGFFVFTGQVTGLSMADFLLGDTSTFIQGNTQYAYERYHYIGLYAEDTWRATPHVTVSAGLRWEPFIGGSMPLGYVMHFDQGLFDQNVHSTVYPNAPAGVLYPGDKGFDTNSRPSHIAWKDFAPRLGVVWDPKGDGKMTIRASWGMFYELPHTLFAYGFSQAPPWGSTITRNNVSFDNPWQGFPGGDPFPLQLGKNFQFPIPGNYTTYPLDLKVTYLEQWNLTIQRQFGANWLASASYLGNNTIHLWADAPVNAAVFLGTGACDAGGVHYSNCGTTATNNARRVLNLRNPAQGQYFGTIHQLDPGSTASYNALLLSLQHRLASHFTVLGNYTWSHCIAGPFTSELDGTQYVNPADRNYDRGNCLGSDRRHLFNVSAVEESPQFSGRMMQAVLGDWKISQIMRIQSGDYLTITSGFDQALNGIGGQRAQQILQDPLPAQQSLNEWFNTGAFDKPALGTFGNLGVANILGPGAFQFDMSLVRQIKLGEGRQVELRGEAFNLFNHYRPFDPGTALNSAGTFGKITNSGDPRIMQFAVKYVF